MGFLQECANAGTEPLVLDPRIRDWVLLPIFFIMLIVGILKNYISLLIKTKKKSETATVISHQILQRARVLRQSGHWLHVDSFLMRRQYLCSADVGLLNQKQQAAVNPMMDPLQMVDMLKGNFSMVLPQMLQFAFISYFFAGFVLLKLPFPLTSGFKAMMQRGINLTTLDVSYVSSLSWYFLNMFGLRGIYTLILGANNAGDDAVRMQQMQMNPMGQGGANFKQEFSNESESLQLIYHKWMLVDVEDRLIKQWEFKC